MTRINADYNPKGLTDQHLLAEYRELPMVHSALRKSLRTRKANDIIKGIPKDYTLNKGHVTFFYDKLLFLNNRYERLKIELTNRGFQLDTSRILDNSGIPFEFFNDWVANDNDEEIIKQRLREKISMKKGWYKYYGKQLDNNFEV